jgi:hypothetical protein
MLRSIYNRRAMSACLAVNAIALLAGPTVLAAFGVAASIYALATLNGNQSQHESPDGIYVHLEVGTSRVRHPLARCVLKS